MIPKTARYRKCDGCGELTDSSDLCRECLPLYEAFKDKLVRDRVIPTTGPYYVCVSVGGSVLHVGFPDMAELREWLKNLTSLGDELCKLRP